MLEGRDASSAIRTQDDRSGREQGQRDPGGARGAARASSAWPEAAAASCSRAATSAPWFSRTPRRSSSSRASIEVRAQRRRDELLARGTTADLEAVRSEVIERDRRDSERAVAPLLQAADATLVDSSTLSVAEVVERIVQRVRQVERELLA